MTSSKLQIGIAGIVVLVMLRLVIGWHFFKEGAKKFTDPNFTASGFLQISHGPMAPLFKNMIPNRFGLVSLDKARTGADWTAYETQVANFYRFSKEQREKAAEVRIDNIAQFDAYIDFIEGDIYEFKTELFRFQEDLADTVTRDVEYQRARNTIKERELLNTPRPWLAEIDSLRKRYRMQLYEIGDEKQRERGLVPMPDPSRMTLLNAAVKWTVILVGVFLILGLFTRIFSLVGVGFLCSVIASQMPGCIGAEPTYYQAIELVALLVLMVTGAGRFAGLDYFLEPIFSPFCKRFCCPTKGTPNESNA